MRRAFRGLMLSAAISGIGFTPALAQLMPNPPATRPAENEQTVPVKEVVLYTSGVGYFEHFGIVRGNASTELSFKAAQINDILKSLLIEDMDGGKVSAVTYASQAPLERTLRSFEVDLNNNPSLSTMLNQLRGSSVTVSLSGSAPMSGQVLGVEQKHRPSTDGKTMLDVWSLNLVLPSGAIRPIDLDLITEIHFDDPKLQQELVKALAAVAAARDQDKKPVAIRFDGQGQRHVRIGYVVEAPVWKTSYRLVLASDAKNEAVGAGKNQPVGLSNSSITPGPGDALKAPETQPTGGADGGNLLGWAIIENQTDNDWEGVELSLVSGRPISFIEDLYQPLFVPRPVVQPELYASLRPQTYVDSLAREPQVLHESLREVERGSVPTGGGRGGGNFAGRGGFGGGSINAASLATTLRPIDVASSVSSLASGEKVGEFFQYTVPSVTLPRQKSAMLPILSEGVKVRRVSIYNASVFATNPLLGARVTNTTGKLLPQGPITILDGGVYAGDAKIDDLPAGQNRLLSYGIDQQVLVHSNDHTSDAHVGTAKIVKGVLELTAEQEFSQEYIAQNKGKTDRTLLIEHPKRPGWTLSEPAAAESTDTLYRFEEPLDAGKTRSLTIKEQITTSQAVTILPMDTGAMETYIKTGPIPQPVKDALAKAAKFKYAVADTQRQIQTRQQQINEFNQDQSRIRENMKTVAPTSDYYQKLLKKLEDQETAIEKLQAESKQLQQQAQQQKKELEDYLAGLDVG